MLGSSLRYLLPGEIAMYIRAGQSKAWAIRWAGMVLGGDAGDGNLNALCDTAGSSITRETRPTGASAADQGVRPTSRMIFTITNTKVRSILLRCLISAAAVSFNVAGQTRQSPSDDLS